MSRIPTLPLPPNGFLHRQMETLNAAIQQVSELASITTDQSALLNRGPTGTTLNLPSPTPVPHEFFGVLVNSGPYGDADMSDARYWVQSVNLNQVENAAFMDLTKPYCDGFSATAVWLIATSLSEAIAGTHSLPVISPNPDNALPLPSGATLVRVRMVNAGKMTTNLNDEANTVWVFEPVNNISGEKKINLTGTTTIGGTVALSGATYRGQFVTPATGTLSLTGSTLTLANIGTASGTDEVYWINKFEYGTTNHDMMSTANKSTLVSGIATGLVASDGKPIYMGGAAFPGCS